MLNRFFVALINTLCTAKIQCNEAPVSYHLLGSEGGNFRVSVSRPGEERRVVLCSKMPEGIKRGKNGYDLLGKGGEVVGFIKDLKPGERVNWHGEVVDVTREVVVPVPVGMCFYNKESDRFRVTPSKGAQRIGPSSYSDSTSPGAMSACIYEDYRLQVGAYVVVGDRGRYDASSSLARN